MRTSFSCFRLVALALLVIALGAMPVTAAWPTYQGDPGRSGATKEAVHWPVRHAWTYLPTQPPRPAWPEPGKEMHRLDFDYALQPVSDGSVVVFGSSADDTVRALDAKTGRPRWAFPTGGPIRFAPVLADGRCYVAGDDGYVYCLALADGKEVWRFRAAPNDRKMLGNGRMISRWPVRGGVVLADGVLYAAAGMWPGGGVYVYALDAKTGRVRWRNDSSGSQYMNTPHPGASAFTGVAPQGYLAVAGDTLLVPTGRACPAAFDRNTGELKYYHMAESKTDGGTWLTTAGEWYFNPQHARGADIDVAIGESPPRPGDGMWVYGVKDGRKAFALAGKHRVLVAGGVLYAAGGSAVAAYDWNVLQKKRSAKAPAKWSAPAGRTYAMALAGKSLLLGTAEGITAYDTVTGKQTWQGATKGQVRGLAVAGGRIFAATNRGEILCFAHMEVPIGSETVRAEPVWAATPDSPSAWNVLDLIARRPVLKEGYALVAGGDNADASLATALAWRTDLHVVRLVTDRAAADALRRRLVKTNLYGSRLAVCESAAISRTHLASYFANVVVARGTPDAATVKELYRLVHPCGGVLLLVDMDSAAATKALEQAGVPAVEIGRVPRADRALVERGPLTGAGEWRQEWANAGRTGIGSDRRIRMPVEILWFGGPGPDRMMSRHWGTATPLCVAGRVFVTGQHHVLAFSAYNGQALWTRDLREVGRKWVLRQSSNFVADDDSVYVTSGVYCYRLDQATGRTRAIYSVPQASLARVQSARKDGPTYVDVQAPTVWQVLGPLGKRGKLPKGISLAKMPTAPKGKAAYTVRPLPAAHGVLDFTCLYGGYGTKPLAKGEKPSSYPRKGSRRDRAADHQTCYAFAKISSAKPGRLAIAASADWWMTVYLDGRRIYDTMRRGNGTGVTDVTRHVLAVAVTPGEHVLAIRVESGSSGWALKVGLGRPYAPLIERRRRSYAPQWGFLSVVDGTVLGTFRETSATFALDKATGRLRWCREDSGLAAPTGLAVGEGKVFLLEAPSAQQVAIAKRRGKTLDAKPALVACDLVSGKELWRRDVKLSSPNRQVRYANGVVLLSGMTALAADSGEVLWSKPIKSKKPAIIHHDWILAEPNAYYLRTGQQRQTPHLLTGRPVPWRFTRAYGCGAVVGCESLLMFRSGMAGMFDLNDDGTTTFGGVRPGCSANMIAAAGLLLAPESSSGCTCSYNFQTSLALAPARASADQWFYYYAPPARGPIEKVRLNFGAPGDRRDRSTQPWLAWPRPVAPAACPVPVTVKADSPSPWYRHLTATAAVTGTDKPWLYASGAEGVKTITVRLAPPAKPAPKAKTPAKPAPRAKAPTKVPPKTKAPPKAPPKAKTPPQAPPMRAFTVRLHFAELSSARPGQRAFDVALQGKVVLKAFDPVRAAGGANKAVVREFKGVRAATDLVVTLTPIKGKTSLAGIEIVAR